MTIFMLGILMARQDVVLDFRSVCIISIILFLPTYLFLSQFLAGSFLAVPLVIVLANVKMFIPSACISFLNTMGKYTLEIYLAQVVVLYYINTNNYEHSIAGVLSWLIGEVLLSVLLIKLNGIIAFLINKYEYTGKN